MNDVVSLGFDLTQVLDKTEKEAFAILKEHNYDAVVTERDEVSQPVPALFNPKRICLTVNKGIVSAFRRG